MNKGYSLFILTIFVTASLSVVTSNNAYAEPSMYVACAAPPEENPAPADLTTLNYAVINDDEISYSETIADNVQGNARGWDPDGTNTWFHVNLPEESEASSNSIIAISTNDPESFNLCGVNLVVDEEINNQNITKSGSGNSSLQQ
jgi:hypothetical protein